MSRFSPRYSTINRGRVYRGDSGALVGSRRPRFHCAFLYGDTVNANKLHVYARGRRCAFATVREMVAAAVVMKLLSIDGHWL